jgi:hypothetical protein
MSTAKPRRRPRTVSQRPSLRSSRGRASALAFALALSALGAASTARADGYADPPYRTDPPYRHGAAVVDPEDGAPYASEPKPSIVRFFVGPAGKVDKSSASPGLLVAVDLGRGPAGFRATAAWLDVGAEKGLSQYTGELTIDFGGRSRFRPVVGAGGGVARTSSSVRDDGSLDPTTGSTLGIGVVRAGLGFRLPLEDADARVAVDVMGVLPAIRAASAPDIGPWAMGAVTVGIGF